MNPSLLLTGFVLAIILLADPGSSSCGRCDVFVTRTGTLPDTTLTSGSTWEIIISDRFAVEYNQCYYDYNYDVNDSGYSTVDLTWKLDGSTISLQQIRDTLTITALAPGQTKLFLSATGYEQNDPNVVNQHINITVK